ncbi:hypothetical protein FB451DRAFT_1167946 [Mycena latifolia]|nr:hypothetical protein FB451DRAFT_1167946 [Mycena latifolia]
MLWGHVTGEVAAISIVSTIVDVRSARGSPVANRGLSTMGTHGDYWSSIVPIVDARTFSIQATLVLRSRINARLNLNERHGDPRRRPRDRGISRSRRNAAKQVGKRLARAHARTHPAPNEPHSNGSEDDTLEALHELQLAAVERDAQIARLTVYPQHALEDIERARAEAGAARTEAKEARAETTEAQRKNVYDSKSEERGDAGEEHGSSSTEQPCTSQRIKLDTKITAVCPRTPAHVSASVSVSSSSNARPPVSAKASASTPAPSSAPPANATTPRPLSIPYPPPISNPLPLPSRPKTPSAAADSQAANAHATAVTPMSVPAPTSILKSTPILKTSHFPARLRDPLQQCTFQSGTFQLQRPNANPNTGARVDLNDTIWCTIGTQYKGSPPRTGGTRTRWRSWPFLPSTAAYVERWNGGIERGSTPTSAFLKTDAHFYPEVCLKCGIQLQAFAVRNVGMSQKVEDGRKMEGRRDRLADPERKVKEEGKGGGSSPTALPRCRQGISTRELAFTLQRWQKHP